MKEIRDPGRVAGVWYLLLILLGPLRLIYIPSKLFVDGNAAETAKNLAANEWLFRLGLASDLIAAVVLVMMAMALYRLFAGVDKHLAVLVVLFGGVMPAVLYFVGVGLDAGALSIVQHTDALGGFSKPQQNGLAVLLLNLHDHLNSAAEMLWGIWLLPLAILVYRSGFLPRFLGVWLALNGVAYALISLVGELFPAWQHGVLAFSAPLRWGELVFVLWLLFKGTTKGLEST
jgi:hypothetical protein